MDKLEEALMRLYPTTNSSGDIQGAVKLIIEYLQEEPEERELMYLVNVKMA